MARPYSSIDITFARREPGTAPYRLWSDRGHAYAYDLVANVPEQPPCVSWSLGKEGRNGVHGNSKDGGGDLYHAQLWRHSAPGESTPKPIHVAVKWMRGASAIEALRHEAGMYTGPLRGLQGQIVPRFYGFFSGKVDGVEIGCIVLEWCPQNEWVTFGEPNERELTKRMEAVRLLHQAGVEHRHLYDGPERDPHSLRVYDGRHFLRSADGSMRIVGFQKARVHRCAGGLRAHGGANVSLDGKCRELCYAEIHCGAARGGLGDIRWQPF